MYNWFQQNDISVYFIVFIKKGYDELDLALETVKEEVIAREFSTKFPLLGERKEVAKAIQKANEIIEQSFTFKYKQTKIRKDFKLTRAFYNVQIKYLVLHLGRKDLWDTFPSKGGEVNRIYETSARFSQGGLALL